MRESNSMFPCRKIPSEDCVRQPGYSTNQRQIWMKLPLKNFFKKANNTGKLVGLFANEPALIDQILGQAMGNSENMPLRLDC